MIAPSSKTSPGNNIGFQELRIDKRLRRNRGVKCQFSSFIFLFFFFFFSARSLPLITACDSASAEVFCCMWQYASLCAKDPAFEEDLRVEDPRVGSFFSITHSLPPELQLTVTGFMFGTRVLAPTRVISECQPPFGVPDETPFFYWRAGSRNRDNL